MRTSSDTPQGVVFDHAIPTYRMAELDARFAALAKRAAKLGVPAPSYERVGTRVVTRRDEITGIASARAYVLIRVSAPVIKLAGWTFVAVVEHTDAGNLIRHVPHGNVELPVHYRTDGPTCDHCHTVRQRKETFACQHEDGRWTRVGRQCLRDFLGVDPDQVAAQVAFVASVSDDLGEGGLGDWGGGSAERGFRPEDFLAYCAAVVRLDGGYRSRARFENDCTASVALAAMFPGPRVPPHTQHLPQACDAELAERVLAWGRELPAQGLSDYLHNVRMACSLTWMYWRHAGIMASAISSFVQAAERRAALDSVLDEPLAPTGTKLAGSPLPRAQREGGRKQIPPVHAKLLRTQSFEGQYGTTVLHVFASEDGHRLVWWASHDAADNFAWDRVDGALERAVDVGDWVYLAGSIKDARPNKRDGKMETILTRVARCTPQHVAEWQVPT